MPFDMDKGEAIVGATKTQAKGPKTRRNGKPVL
jgi:hypothetical protein